MNVRWDRLSVLRTPVLLLAAVTLIVLGVWELNPAAGKIALGVLLAGFAYMLDYTPTAQAQDAARTAQGVYR